MSEQEQLVSVGQVFNTQGRRGEVRVWPLTDFPERFKPDAVFLLEKAGEARQLTVAGTRPQKKYLVIKFKEISDLNAAEEIKGGLLKVTRDQLVKLPPGTHFVFELIGMEVRTEEGRVLGQVKDIIQTGSNDVYVVAGQAKDYLIPAVKEIVKQIDQMNQRIVIRPLEGLLDL